MPLTFENREHGFEAKFAHDEELLFRITARRDKLFARWASTRYRLSAIDAESLHSAVLAVANGPGHDEALLTLVRTTLARHGSGVPPEGLEAALALCAQQAQEQPPG